MGRRVCCAGAALNLVELTLTRSSVTAAESQSNVTTLERGLAFVAYQSQLNRGFVELQLVWANSENRASQYFF